MTIHDLKVGDMLCLGTYHPNKNDDEATRRRVPIVWIKATKDDLFLSERVLDVLLYDKREGNAFPAGNPDWQTANLCQFLNAQGQDWFEPQHATDTPPDYRSKSGFLSGFEAYEIDSMSSEVSIPEIQDLTKTGFPLFRRRGIRPEPTSVLQNYYWEYTHYKFAPCWTKTVSEYGRIKILSRDGNVHSLSPHSYCGVRPIVRINSSRQVERDDDEDIYTLTPYEVVLAPEMQVIDLTSFLGI